MISRNQCLQLFNTKEYRNGWGSRQAASGAAALSSVGDAELRERSRPGCWLWCGSDNGPLLSLGPPTASSTLKLGQTHYRSENEEGKKNKKCVEWKDLGNTANIFQLNYFLGKIPGSWKLSDKSFALLQTLRRLTSVLAISSLFTACTSCPRCLQRAETSSDRAAHRGSSDRSGPRTRAGTAPDTSFARSHGEGSPWVDE